MGCLCFSKVARVIQMAKCESINCEEEIRRRTSTVEEWFLCLPKGGAVKLRGYFTVLGDFWLIKSISYVRYQKGKRGIGKNS